MCLQDYIGQNVVRKRFWQVRDTGLFFHRELIEEVNMDKPRWVSEVMESSPLFVHIGLTLQYVTLGIRCISMLYQALEMDDEAITIAFRLIGIEGRVLLPEVPVPTVGDWMCRIPEVIAPKSEPLGVWRASTTATAAQIAVEIFRQFNWLDPSVEQLRQRAAQFLQRGSV